jgi:hypothetical protein
VGLLVWVPTPFLALFFILPAVAWLALVGLAVPVAALEAASLRGSFARATRLARADFVHALGSMVTLALLVFLCQSVLFFVLRDQGDQTQRWAAFLANVVVSPLLFLGAALLYYDQEARLRLPRPRRRRSARACCTSGRRSGRSTSSTSSRRPTG